MLNGLIKPDTGRIEMSGQIGALIALGAGFNPLLTGRENILINASVMGLTRRQAIDKIDEIIEFAEIEDFIDSPVQNYSSGMQVRLGFAVATAIAPDILILDEVLAVGDARFRARCYERIDSLLKDTAVIFVSHQADHVARLCNKAILMKPGTRPIPDSVERALEAYEESETRSDVKKETGSLHLISPFTGYRLDLDKDEYLTGECAAASLILNGIFDASILRLRLSIYNQNGEFSADTGYIEMDELGLTERSDGSMQIALSLGPLALKKGTYFISCSILGPNGEIYIWDNRGTQFKVNSNGLGVIPDYQLQIKKADPQNKPSPPVKTL
jgi:lipopolysaccharide transport system ATP-binding protein